MKKSELIRVIREELKAAIKEEESPATKSARIKAVQDKIGALKMQLADAQKELASIQSGG